MLKTIKHLSIGFIICVALILFLLGLANATDVPIQLTQENLTTTSNILFNKSTPDQYKLYKLKIKLLFRMAKDVLFWQHREKLDWHKEIKNWDTGFLSEDKSTLPFIVDKGNFYPDISVWQGDFWIGSGNNMKLIVFNPNDTKIKVDLDFHAGSYRENEKIEVMLDGKYIKDLIFPNKNELRQFVVRNLVLKPGTNHITFSAPKIKNDSGQKSWGETTTERKVNIKFKKFQFSNLAKLESKEKLHSNNGINCIANDEYLDAVLLSNPLGILTREMNLDLKEFPYFDMDMKFKGNVAAQTFVMLGIDYNGDAIIDDYLNLEYRRRRNIFDLAKKEWGEAKGQKESFVLRKIIVLVLPEADYEYKKTRRDLDKEIGVLRIKNLNFYNHDVIFLSEKQLDKSKLIFKNVNMHSKVARDKNTYSILAFFNNAASFDDSKKYISKSNSERGKEGLQEIRIYVDLKKVEKDSFYFSFRYILEDYKLQQIKLGILTQKTKKEEIIDIPENQYKDHDNKIEVNLKQINYGEYGQKLVIRLQQRNKLKQMLDRGKQVLHFQLAEVKTYFKYPYPLKTQLTEDEILELLPGINPYLVKIDDRIYYINDFKGWESSVLENGILTKEIKLSDGVHAYEKIQNPIFDIDWLILEPIRDLQPEMLDKNKLAQITFQKINPTKYLVEVEAAKEPFWLVFSESFHPAWKLYAKDHGMNFNQRISSKIVAEYEDLNVKEAKHLIRFILQDIKYLFKKPLKAGHHLVNGYANSWYIEPKKLGLGENFTMVLYFWPQSLFYLGLGISIITLMCCVCYLIYDGKRRKNQKGKK